MNNNIAPNDVYAITALTIDSRPNDVVAIIRKHGVMLPNNPSTKQIETAFGSLLTKSEAFRKDFGDLATKVASEGYSNAVGDDLPPPKGISTTKTGQVTLDNIPTNITSTGGTAKYTPSTKSKIASWFSSIFTPETIQNTINTGLNIWSVKQTGQPANLVSGDLNAGRDQLNQGNQPPTKGTSTTTLVLIGVGAIVLIGVAVYFYKKKS